MRTYTAYALICPIRKKPFYVGITHDPTKRLYGHRSYHRPDNTSCNNSAYMDYMKALRSFGWNSQIKIQVLEEGISEKEKETQERYWIIRVGKLATLTNSWHYSIEPPKYFKLYLKGKIPATVGSHAKQQILLAELNEKLKERLLSIAA